MLLAEIDSRVNAAIRSDQVFNRVLALAIETIELSDEHKKAASYSLCQCPYCAAIKVYVRAKRSFKYMQGGHYFLSRLAPTEMDIHEAEQRMIAARKIKDLAKAQTVYPILLAE